MAIAVQQIRPVAHLPLVLGVLRRLEVASLIDALIPPHPAPGLSTGRGVEALVLAILDGDHALYKVGQRLEERGMVALVQPGLTQAALHDYRLGHILDALCAANLNKVLSAVALSKRWRSMPCRRPGCIRIPPPLRSMAPMRTSRRRPEHHGQPTDTAKTGGTSSNRCSSVSG